MSYLQKAANRMWISWNLVHWQSHFTSGRIRISTCTFRISWQIWV